jgi:hypothetical protein
MKKDEENSVLDRYNKYYNISGSPMTKMILNDQRKTYYNSKPQIISNNLPAAFEFPKEKKRRYYLHNNKQTDRRNL